MCGVLLLQQLAKTDTLITLNYYSMHYTLHYKCIVLSDVTVRAPSCSNSLRVRERERDLHLRWATPTRSSHSLTTLLSHHSHSLEKFCRCSLAASERPRSECGTPVNVLTTPSLWNWYDELRWFRSCFSTTRQDNKSQHKSTEPETLDDLYFDFFLFWDTLSENERMLFHA